MLYMKGTPARPQCGFSAQIVRVLHASGVDFDSVNVLDYPMIREGVKKYSYVHASLHPCMLGVWVWEKRSVGSCTDPIGIITW